MTWRDCVLGDVVTLKRGHDLPERIREPGHVPVVSSSGITGFHNESKADPPGVVTGRYGTLGEVYYLQEPYWPLNTALYVVDFHGTNPRFAAHILRNTLRNYRSEKAAVPGFDRNVLHRLEVRIPSATEQETIASALSAYDDLIENNRRRIALLEESARLLYREWFVRFRFPGHERVRIVDGVPDGWLRQPLVQHAEVVMGQSPKSQFYNEVGEGLPFHQGVTDFGRRFVSHRVFSTAGNRVAEAGDILISVRAPVGRINVTRDRIVIGRGLAAVRSRQETQSFLLYALNDHFFAEDLIGTGAIYAATNKRELEGQLLLRPVARLMLEFESRAAELDRQISCLTGQNENLAKARDLLLPHLMNGDVSV